MSVARMACSTRPRNFSCSTAGSACSNELLEDDEEATAVVPSVSSNSLVVVMVLFEGDMRGMMRRARAR